ncbi:MAG: hypothetical protein WDZ77_01950 [Candidatus Pacearchaeota archaeon]
MQVKTKKQNADGSVRLETSGEIKEILINEDFMNPNNASVSLCFRGKNSSGIIELSAKEIESISKQISPSLHLLRDVKVMKFKK